MRTTVVHTLGVLLVTLWIAAPAAGGQDPKEDLLTAEEMEELVANASTAEDHLRLARHFTVAADQYDASAEQHLGMARAYPRNPNRRTRRAGSAHCQRLARLARESATAARALAAEHEEAAAALEDSAARE